MRPLFFFSIRPPDPCVPRLLPHPASRRQGNPRCLRTQPRHTQGKPGDIPLSTLTPPSLSHPACASVTDRSDPEPSLAAAGVPQPLLSTLAPSIPVARRSPTPSPIRARFGPILSTTNSSRRCSCESSRSPQHYSCPPPAASYFVANNEFNFVFFFADFNDVHLCAN